MWWVTSLEPGGGVRDCVARQPRLLLLIRTWLGAKALVLALAARIALR